MKDPYEILGVPANADEVVLRQRYLELVRRHTPDQSPQRFAEIWAAYDELRDPVKRLEREILEVHDDDTLDAIIAEVRQRLRGAKIPVQALLALGDS